MGWNSLYWNNHDQPRAVSRFGDDGEYRVQSAKLLGTILHLHRGTPYIYQGEELGMTNVLFAGTDAFRDIESINQYAAAIARGDDPEATLAGLRVGSRDNVRSPMQWDGTAQAGFTDGTPWFPVNPNATEMNATTETADANSVFHHYRKLIALRHDLPVVQTGDFTMLLPEDRNGYAFIRSLDGVTLLVLGNFSAKTVPVDLPDAADWAGSEMLLGNYPMNRMLQSTITLRPWESRVYRRSQERRFLILSLMGNSRDMSHKPWS